MSIDAKVVAEQIRKLRESADYLEQVFTLSQHPNSIASQLRTAAATIEHLAKEVRS